MAHILYLPDELLVDILKLAIPPPKQTNWHTPDSPYEHKTILPIIYTCRRFSRLAKPLLYYSLDFRHRFDCIPLPNALKSLQRTLQTYPQLGHFCQRLRLRVESHDLSSEIRTINGGKEYEEEFSCLKQLCSALPNVKFLEICGGFNYWSHQTGDFLQTCAENMPTLEHASFYQNYGRPYAAIIVKYFRSPSLKKLQIIGRHAFRYGIETIKDKSPSNITSLRLIEYDESIYDIATLIDEMSTALEEFHFTTPYCYSILGLSLRAIGDMLQKHTGSLKTLNLGYMVRGADLYNNTVIDLSRFTALQDLFMSRAHFGLQHRAGLRDWDKEWADLLLAPNCKTLTLDYEIPQGTNKDWRPIGTFWEDFTEEDEQWWRDFAQEAVARKSSLREIHMRYNPTFFALDFGDDTYRWDRIDKLMEEFGPQGIKFTYDKPDLSRSDWHDWVYGWTKIFD